MDLEKYETLKANVDECLEEVENAVAKIDGADELIKVDDSTFGDSIGKKIDLLKSSLYTTQSTLENKIKATKTILEDNVLAS